MRETEKKAFIGFPQPLLGDKSVRINIVSKGHDWFILNKPSGISLRQHPWDRNMPNIEHALNLQLGQGKREIMDMESTLLGSVYYMDMLMSGGALYAKSKAALADLRNAYGSGLMKFKFHFLAQAKTQMEDMFEIDTPLLPHQNKCQMIPSISKGKQSKTKFSCINRGFDGWGLWEANVNFFRPHQIRIHAALSGLKLMNECIYSVVKAPTLKMIGMEKKMEDFKTPIFSDLALHLSRLEFKYPESKESFNKVKVPQSKSFRLACKYLHLL